MPLTGIRLKGHKELNRYLTTAIRRIPKEERKEFRRAVQPIVKQAKQDIPERTGVAKRKLGAKIKTVRTLAGGKLQLVAMHLRAEIGTFGGAWWSHFIERGTRRHSLGSGSTLGGGKHGPRRQHGRGHPGIPGELFVGNAVDKNFAKVARAFSKPIRRL